MVTHSRKRLNPSSESKSQSNKRYKIGIVKNPEAVQKKQVPLDVLPWSHVKLPDTFEDASGFFGLEEVDGVEVVREGNLLKFITSEVKSKNYEDEFNGFDEDEHSNIEDQIQKLEKSSKQNLENKDKTKKESNKTQSKKKIPELSNDSKSLSFRILTEVHQKEIDVSAWIKLDLSSNMLSALSKLGFSKPTPIQAASIRKIIAGHDLIGKASTGSGKTLAFAIPIVESWLESNDDSYDHSNGEQRSATALILSPTRELAHQLEDHINKLCSGLSNSPQLATVTGGLSLQKQERKLSKADIIIGTPGRLWEVMSSYPLILRSLKCIKFLVIDEADRLLSDGHFKEVEEILSTLDHQENTDDDKKNSASRQTLIFSATFERGLQQKLTGRSKQGHGNGDDQMEYLLKKLNFREEKPKFVDVNPVSQMAENLREGIVECTGTEKDYYLYALLLHHPNKRTLIFTNSIHSVRRLTPLLQNLGLKAQALHSQMAQKARMRSIERFSSPNCLNSILIATDVAARGLDIKGVQLVIHYHLPRAADIYVHRSGRTARVDASGISILMCAPEEVVGMRRLIAKVHAQNAITGGGAKSKYYMKSLDLNGKIVSRIKPRVILAKKIADSNLAKQKSGHDNEWLKNAAQELGVEYDSDEFDAACGERKGRGTGRRLKEKEARNLSKNELYAMREELKCLLAQRVNVGISERYLAATGNVNVNELLTGAKGEFLGTTDGMALDDIQ